MCSNDTVQFGQCGQGRCIVNLKNTNDFKCECDLGWTGALCESPICKDYCHNDGQCSDGLGEYNYETERFNATKVELSCACSSKRFSGERCEFDLCRKEVDEKKCPSNCTLDSSCKCLCGQECDQFYCNKKMGVCYAKDNTLSCK